MKQLYKIIIILFFICLKSYSQNHEATMYFKDGDSIEGLAYLKFNKIKFKIGQEDKFDTWDEEFVKKITFIDFGATRSFEYVKLNSLDKPKLVEIITQGEATLYKKLGSDYSITDLIYNPYDDRPTNSLDTNLSSDFKSQVKKQTGLDLANSRVKEPSEFYYIKKGKDTYPTCLNCGVLNAWRNKTSKVFADCDYIVKKLKGDKWLFEDIKEIVEFYNDICLGE
ncbi:MULTISPECIES: hypothetical protein [Flavobacterium]|jgi:hypothetical protein|uniref:hypothetical protein n=1 Tax=Flavobacterium TaxID=237 RepID=UPI0011836176|nr:MULTISPECIES: hypothetical protein [Flavobacterium]MCR4032216.1 hypothetical protein [Flavobacterium panacis]